MQKFNGKAYKFIKGVLQALAVFLVLQINVALAAPAFVIGNNANQFASEVAAVLNAMAAHENNAGQVALVNDFLLSPSTAALIYNLNEMVPNINVSTANLHVMQAMLNKVEVRASAAFDKKPLRGIASGELCSEVSLWAGGLGNIARQNQNSAGLNTGYRIRASGGVVGIDTRLRSGTVFGIAGASSNANIYEMSHNNYTTRTLSYYGLFYGSLFSRHSFLEWTFAAAANKNVGSRPINVNGSNLRVKSSYRSWQGATKFNIGNYIDWSDTFRWSYLFSLQYDFLYQPQYSEHGSVAALNVAPPHSQNTLTLGTGVRLALPGCDQWYTGSREIRASVTYDVIQPSQLTTANFVVGSLDFSLNNAAQARLSADFGADWSFNFGKHAQLQFSYDYGYSAGFYDHAGEVTFRYVF